MHSITSGPLQEVGSHPQRARIHDELHARPFLRIDRSSAVVHLAVIHEGHRVTEATRHAARLAERWGEPTPDPAESCLTFAADGAAVRWERHSEFSTYTVVAPDPGTDPLGLLDEAWLAAMPGELVVAFRVEIRFGPTPEGGADALRDVFGDNQIFGSRVVDGRASIWSDFRIHDDGLGRVVICNEALSRYQVGRTLQRVIDVHTYTAMALLGFPRAREVLRMVHEVDAEIFEATDRLDRLADAADQQQAWLGVSRLAARVEQERLLADHRFGATAAYARIVTDRMNDLREEKFVGTSTWTKFIERRFMPAVRTCEAADSRLENLARRVARTGDLLQARIQLSLEAQNARLFEAMNSASQRQVRLQQTVEGLSVAAISYYVVGLIKLAIDGVPGLPRPDLFVAASVLPVVLAVWWTVRSIRRRIGTHAAD